MRQFCEKCKTWTFWRFRHAIKNRNTFLGRGCVSNTGGAMMVQVIACSTCGHANEVRVR